MLVLSAFPALVWPVLVLAGVQIVDGVLSVRPAAFVAQCLADVGWPRAYWRALPVLKFAAAAALVAGLWVPYLALLTTAALVAYFVSAIGLHIRAQDYGRNLFVNASGMLVLCVAVFVGEFVRILP